MQIDLFVDDRLLFSSKKNTVWNGDVVFYAESKVLKLSGDYKNRLIIELITKDKTEGGDDRYDLD